MSNSQCRSPESSFNNKMFFWQPISLMETVYQRVVNKETIDSLIERKRELDLSIAFSHQRKQAGEASEAEKTLEVLLTNYQSLQKECRDLSWIREVFSFSFLPFFLSLFPLPSSLPFLLYSFPFLLSSFPFSNLPPQYFSFFGGSTAESRWTFFSFPWLYLDNLFNRCTLRSLYMMDYFSIDWFISILK